jgi:hypothetical protein
MLTNQASIEEHPKRVLESVQISRAEWLLIQQIRAVRKRAVAWVDVGGDGVPKAIRVVECAIVDLTK